MKKQNLILEEIKRARLLFGYDTSKTLHEQTYMDPPNQPGDADGDGDVDDDDLSIVQNNWTKGKDDEDWVTMGSQGDLDGDGYVGVDDLQLVINNMGQGSDDWSGDDDDSNDGITTSDTYTPNYVTQGPYSGNFVPDAWWTSFIANAESRPNYSTNKCNFFETRVRTWQGKLPKTKATGPGGELGKDTPGYQLGDSNYDGVVDQTDMDYVTNNWLQDGDVYDSNDGIINNDDLTLVINNFGQGTATDNSVIMHQNMLNVKIEMTNDFMSHIGCSV